MIYSRGLPQRLRVCCFVLYVLQTCVFAKYAVYLASAVPLLWLKLKSFQYSAVLQTKHSSSLLHHSAMPPAQLGTKTLMEEWELVEDVPEDMGADITHNNVLSSIRGILSQYDTPGHYSPISMVP